MNHTIGCIIFGLLVMIAVAAIFVDKLTSEMEKARVLLYSDDDFYSENKRARATSTECTNIPQNISQKNSIGTLGTPEKIISLEEYKRLHR